MEKAIELSPFIMNFIREYDAGGTDAALMEKIAPDLAVMPPLHPTLRINPGRMRKGTKRAAATAATVPSPSSSVPVEKEYNESDLSAARAKSEFAGPDVKPAEYSDILLFKTVVPLMVRQGTYFLYGYYTGPTRNDVKNYRLFPRRLLNKVSKHIPNQRNEQLRQLAPTYDATAHKAQHHIQGRHYPMIDIRLFADLYHKTAGDDGEDAGADDGSGVVEENNTGGGGAKKKKGRKRKAGAATAKKKKNATKPLTPLDVLSQRAFDLCTDEAATAGKFLVNEVVLNERGDVEIPDDICLYFQSSSPETKRLTMKPTLQKNIPVGPPRSNTALFGHQLRDSATVQALFTKIGDAEFMANGTFTLDENALLDLAAFIFQSPRVVVESAINLCFKRLDKPITEEFVNECLAMVESEQAMIEGIEHIFMDCVLIQYHAMELYAALIRYRILHPPPSPPPAEDKGVALPSLPPPSIPSL
jgi:hypothetical protein